MKERSRAEISISNTDVIVSEQTDYLPPGECLTLTVHDTERGSARILMASRDLEIFIEILTIVKNKLLSDG